jgi:hypothetical protein
MKAQILTICSLLHALGSTAQSSTQLISIFGYDNCIEIKNDVARVVLDPNVGGRILVYSINGKNILYINHEMDGKIWKEGTPRFEVTAGRFDIGPEKTTPPRKSFFNTWTGEITGNNSARMVSQIDTVLGVQLIRDFILMEGSSQLKCIQHIKNISNTVQTYAHWSRTFATGGGICLVPLNPNSRLPKGYAIYRPNDLLDFDPAAEENLKTRDGILEILGPPSDPKLVMDSNQGWLAYIAKDDLLFVKKFKADENRLYGDMLSNQVSIWYYKNEKCEVEPIGPIETIAPGHYVSFTEDWWLMPFEYPEDKKVDIDKVKNIVKKLNW